MNILAVFVAAQVLLVVGAVAREEYLLHNGTEIRLRTRPVDPWDVLRGQYVTRAYEMDDLTNVGAIRWLAYEGDTVYVMLSEGDDGIWTVVDAGRDRESESSRPEGTVVIHSKVTYRSDDGLWVTYNNLGRFYVEEGTRNPETNPIAVVVVSGDGVAWP